MKTRWRVVYVEGELAEVAERTVETGRYRNLSEFVSEAIQLRLDDLRQRHEKILEKQPEHPVIHERLLYTSNHIWAMVTPEGNVRVGLSGYAQRHLNGVTAVHTSMVGSEVNKGEPFGTVETWMFKFEMDSPVSGKIARINNIILEMPFLISNDPYETTWIAEIEPNSPIRLGEELKDLMTPRQYKPWVTKLSRQQPLST